MTVTERLFALQDEAYGDFTAKLMPTVERAAVIGVRQPEIRRIARELSGSTEAEDFLKSLPHKYYEENNLHAFLIERIKDYDRCIAELDSFLPFVDNWATCDCMSPGVLRKQPERTEAKIREWMASDETYTVRFGIGILMKYYLDGLFKTEHADAVSELRSGEYYIKMMQAWYFATALAKHYDEVLPYIENRCLDRWTHNKAIQKAVESYRITDEQKAYLRTLKIK